MILTIYLLYDQEIINSTGTRSAIAQKKMGQQISSHDDARTQVVAEDTHSRSPNLEFVPNSEYMCRASLSNPVQSQVHTADNTTSKQPPKQCGNVCKDTSRLTTPLKASLVLQNKGNVARDHLASERTYLAYVRTSLACASAGVGESIRIFHMKRSLIAWLNDQHSCNYSRFPVPQT